METKLIAQITFNLLGVGFIVTDAIWSRIHTFLDGCILFVLLIYFILRYYIRLQRDWVALRRERFEQDQREIKSK